MGIPSSGKLLYYVGVGYPTTTPGIVIARASHPTLVKFTYDFV